MASTKKIVTDLSSVVKFEQWMRFYFIKKEGEDLVIAPDADHMKKIKALYGEFYELAEAMCQVKMTPQNSQRLILDCIWERFDGKEYKSKQIHKTLDGKEFTTEIYLFNTWLELHDDQLSQQIIGFDEWVGLFETWKDSEQGQKVLLSMESTQSGAQGGENSSTVH
ncbi:hypothetical protein [Desulfoplanes sp.]